MERAGIEPATSGLQSGAGSRLAPPAIRPGYAVSATRRLREPLRKTPSFAVDYGDLGAEARVVPKLP